MSREKYRKLADKEKKGIVKFIGLLTRTAKSRDEIVAKLGWQALILAMWRWTADGVNIKTGRVSKDRFKYSGEVHAKTTAAAKVLECKSLERKDLGSLLCHEHVVPRKCLANIIVKEKLTLEEVFQLLERCCLAVVAEKKEAKKELTGSSMPHGWDWRKDDPYARYVKKRIKLIWPRKAANARD